MITTRTATTAENVFRRARVWSLARSAPAVVALLIVIVLAAVFNTMLPLLFGLLPLALLVRLVFSHYTETVRVTPYSLTMNSGTFGVQSVRMPFWRLHVESKQPFLGRIFNYGTIRVLFDGVWYELHGVGSFATVQALIARRQAQHSILAHLHDVEAVMTRRSRL